LHVWPRIPCAFRCLRGADKPHPTTYQWCLSLFLCPERPGVGASFTPPSCIPRVLPGHEGAGLAGAMDARKEQFMRERPRV
jgi:hypothetical protein